MTIEDYLDKASDSDWKLALDLELEDMEEFSHWVYKSIESRVDKTNIARFCERFVRGQVIKPEDFEVRDLLWIVMCEEPEISRRALLLLREKYMAYDIDYVTERVARMNGWEG